MRTSESLPPKEFLREFLEAVNPEKSRKSENELKKEKLMLQEIVVSKTKNQTLTKKLS